MKKTYLTKNQREWVEIFAYIVVGYLIAVGANKGLAYGLQTDYPVVAVVSTSMEHADPAATHYSFLHGKNFTDAQISGFPFDDGIRMGDIVVVKGTKFENINVGDVIVYKFGGGEPIIHRVIEAKDGKLYTKGDNNNGVDQESNIASPINPENVKGRAILRIPLLGYVKIIYLKLIKKG